MKMERLGYKRLCHETESWSCVKIYVKVNIRSADFTALGPKNAIFSPQIMF
jgi:hypothetical protein